MHSYVQTENLIHFYYGFYLSFVVLKSWKRGETATVVLAQYRSIFFFFFCLRTSRVIILNMDLVMLFKRKE